MPCIIQPIKKTNFVVEGGKVKVPCGPWQAGYPTKNTYDSIDFARYRSGCQSSPRVNNFRKPTSYANAYCYYLEPEFDYSGTSLGRLKGRTSQGTFYGGPGYIGGILDFGRWVNTSGSCTNLLFDSAMYNASIAEATAKVADRKLNALESLAEAKESALMIAARIVQILAALRNLRRGNVSGMLRALGLSGGVKGFSGTAAEIWLEYQYGWKPLLSDIYGSCQALREGLRDGKGIFTVKSTKSTGMNAPRGRPNGIVTWKYEHKLRASVTTQYYFRISNPYLATLESLGILNPALLAWELIPFSFVIDWLIPIGTWLEGLTSTIGTEFVGGYTTYSTRVIEKCEWADIAESAIACGRIPRGQVVIYQFQRTAWNSWPEAHVYIKSPLSSSHIASALALLRQQHSRR